MSEWSKEVLARNLTYYMKLSGKTQKELAEIIGVSPPTFNEYIKAKKYPRIDKIERLATYFGILKSDLIEDKCDEKGKTSYSVSLMEMASELHIDIELLKQLEDARLTSAESSKTIEYVQFLLSQRNK